MPRPTHAALAARPLSNTLRRVPNEVLLIRLKRRSRRAKASFDGIHCLEFMWQGQEPAYAHDGRRYETLPVLSWKIHKGPIPEGHDVQHYCGSPQCWEPKHLWSGTPDEARRYRMAKTRRLKLRKPRPASKLRGTNHPHALLTEKQARSILSAKPTGIKGTHLAAQYDVSPELVYGIWSGRNWGWLK